MIEYSLKPEIIGKVALVGIFTDVVSDSSLPPLPMNGIRQKAEAARSGTAKYLVES
jgi:hypothetical protein